MMAYDSLIHQLLNFSLIIFLIPYESNIEFALITTLSQFLWPLEKS